jgi:hypothetical protein
MCPPGNVWDDTATMDLLPLPWPTARVLRHECADGSWHFDFLLASQLPVQADQLCAIGVRVLERPDQMEPGTRQAAEPLPTHRALYLALRGSAELTGNRGRVTPVAAGTLATESPPELALPKGARWKFHVQWSHGQTTTYELAHTPEHFCVLCLSRTVAP